MGRIAAVLADCALGWDDTLAHHEGWELANAMTPQFAYLTPTPGSRFETPEAVRDHVRLTAAAGSLYHLKAMLIQVSAETLRNHSLAGAQPA